MMSAEIKSIDPAAAREWLSRPNPPQLVDVRTPAEFAIASLPSSTLIPMQEIVYRYDELRADEPVILICHHGIRSLQVAYFLRSKGFDEPINLAGGIERWSLEVDPSVPRY